MAKYKKINALFTQPQLERLTRLAESKGVGVTAVIRWAVDDYQPLFLTGDSLECNDHSPESFDPTRARREHPVTIRETTAEYK